MSRKWVYRLGVVVIIFAVLKTPASFLIFGKVEKGEVIEIVFEQDGISIFPTSSYPKVQFKYQNEAYSILGEENEMLLVGDDVKVIFYQWNPKSARIYSFWSLFIDVIIQLPIGLLIWWALFKSYPKMFESNSPH